jgi:hypothetical protein
MKLPSSTTRAKVSLTPFGQPLFPKNTGYSIRKTDEAFSRLNSGVPSKEVTLKIWLRHGPKTGTIVSASTIPVAALLESL